MTWVRIKRIIPQKAKKFGLDNELKLFDLKKEWDKIVEESLGKKFQKKSETSGFKNEILYIRCKDAAWANEFQIKKENLLVYIKNKKIKVKQIRFVF